jgi:hypothetical protein
MTLKSDIPEGYVECRAWYNGKEVVVLYDDLGECPDEDSGHNCDLMGCGSLSHVVGRLQVQPAKEAP